MRLSESQIDRLADKQIGLLLLQVALKVYTPAIKLWSRIAIVYVEDLQANCIHQ